MSGKLSLSDLNIPRECDRAVRVAVVDDEEITRNEIAQIISRLYGRDKVSCFLYSDGDEILESLRKGFPFDAVFLDIEMKKMDGMTAASKIREFLPMIPIIFLTSHTEMAMEGYEVRAFRFLAKPIDENKLRQTLTDLEKLLYKDEKIVLRSCGEDQICSLRDILYIEALNNNVRYVMKDSQVCVRMKFTEALKSVESSHDNDFCKIHRSFCVNLAHVRKMGASECIMDNGDSLPVARASSQEAKKALFDHIRRTGR